MPTVLRKDGFRFFFYSNEGNPIEPLHIHVQKAGAEAKFWMSVEVSVARSDGFDAKTLRKLTEIIEANRNIIEDRWNEYFS